MLNKDCGFGTKAIHAGNVKAQSSAKTHRQVERLDMFGQGPDGDIVDPGEIGRAHV